MKTTTILGLAVIGFGLWYAFKDKLGNNYPTPTIPTGGGTDQWGNETEGDYSPTGMRNYPTQGVVVPLQNSLTAPILNLGISGL
jgi:hypothetical protein